MLPNLLARREAALSPLSPMCCLARKYRRQATGARSIGRPAEYTCCTAHASLLMAPWASFPGRHGAKFTASASKPMPIEICIGVPPHPAAAGPFGASELLQHRRCRRSGRHPRCCGKVAATHRALQALRQELGSCATDSTIHCIGSRWCFECMKSATMSAPRAHSCHAPLSARALIGCGGANCMYTNKFIAPGSEPNSTACVLGTSTRESAWARLPQ